MTSLVGIEQIAFATSKAYIEMADLAKARGVDPKKYLEGIGQTQMAVPDLSEDIVTLAANAALRVLEKHSKEAISLLIVATESGVDQSKAAAVYVHRLLKLAPRCRAVEMKEACYAGTAALQLAANYVRVHPSEQALVICSDVARYGLHTAGEPTQGAGAVAMLIKAAPSIAVINDDAHMISEDCMDFWRPNYQSEALVQGKLSLSQYLKILENVWQVYQAATGLSLADFAAFCLHIPYTKMGEKGLRRLLQGTDEATKLRLQKHFALSTSYNRRIGNVYTASLYLSLLSLLENTSDLKAGDRIGLYSYGSGSVGECFSMSLVDGFKRHLQQREHEAILAARKQLTIAEYEKHFLDQLPTDGTTRMLEVSVDGQYHLLGIKDHQRLYGIGY